MTNLKRIALVLLAFVSTALYASAQEFSVKIKLVDAGSGEGVEYATVSLTKEGSDKVFKYAQSDGKGMTVLTGVVPGRYVIKGILLGYEEYSETIEVNKDLNLGTKKMKVQAEFLKGAQVVDVANPIIVKKDTIEHNVGMMKVSDNDVLEDLLKRIPGVEVASDGTITANGKTINKIQIDGKEFFTNDPSLASKNLPAKIIDKVRVVEKKSEQAQFTGIDDGEEETVIDLGVKKGMMNGWLGNFSAGGGSDIRDADAAGNAQKNDFRYQGAGMAANFTEKSQLAFIGNINNTNNRGFQDMMASTMGGMRGGGMRGGNNTGISNSFMLGGNGGYTFPDKSEIVANAMGNGNRRYVEELSDRKTYNTDGSTLYAKDTSASTNWTYGIRAGARADIKVTEKTSFLFDPHFNYGWGKFDENESFNTDKFSAEGLQQKVNNGLSKSFGNSTSTDADGRLLWRQRLGKPGRTISVNARYSFSKSTLDGNNYSLTNSYSDFDEKGEQHLTQTIVDQQYNQITESNGINARATYTEPLGKNYYMEASYGINYSRRTTSKETYDKDDNGNYTILDETYSSRVKSDNTRHNIGLNFKKQEEKFNLSVGASLMPQRQVNSTQRAGVDTTLVLDVLNWSPNARLDVNFTDHKMLRFNYRGNTTNPTMTQLMPIPDNSNPQRQTLGNLGLNPSFTHNMMIMYRGTNTETFASINAELNGSLKPHSIVNASWTNSEGVQYTVPVNYDKPTYSASGFFMINSPIAKSKFSIMSMTRLSYNNGISYVGNNPDIDPTNPTSFLNLDNYSSNGYQNVSAMERLRFTFRSNAWEVALGGAARYSQAFYEIASKNEKATWNNSVDGMVVLNTNVLSFSTDARYNFYIGYADGYNTPAFVWNFELSKQFFKNQMTVAVKAYDILNQSKNTSRTTTDNYVLDKWNNTLGRYVVLTLTYRFGTFGGMKMGRGMGPGSPGPGGPGPGMGGPPRM